MTEPDEEAVMQHYLSAVARAYDPHSDYMSPATKEDFDMEMNLTLCGVGAVLTMDDGALKIAEVMPGGPMDVDGRIKEGDKIIGVKQGDGELEDIMWPTGLKAASRDCSSEAGSSKASACVISGRSTATTSPRSRPRSPSPRRTSAPFLSTW